MDRKIPSMECKVEKGWTTVDAGFPVITIAGTRCRLEKLAEKRVSDGLSLGMEPLKQIHDFGPSLPCYPLPPSNCLLPSGGGLVHPLLIQQCLWLPLSA